MTRKTVVQHASLALVSAVTASFGMTSFVTADTISHTGPHEQHKVKPIIKNKCEIDTENNVDIENENKQKAESGSVSIKGEEHKEDHHDKWESESPKSEAKPASVKVSDPAEEELMTADQPATMSQNQEPGSDSEGQSTESTEQPSTKSEDHGDHEDHGQSKVGNISTGDAINSNESKFEVNIETDNECPVIKRVPKVHKPEHKVQPSMKPKAVTPKAAAPQVSAGAGQGGGFGAGVAPRAAQVQQPVAPPSRPVQPPAQKQVAPQPPAQVSNTFKATTTNNVSISNSNYQHAESGSVEVKGNTHVGNVSTGDAINNNSTRASVNIETSNTAN